MMKNRIWTAILAVAISLPVLAQPGGGRPGGSGAPDPAARHEFMAGYLGLSESQKEQAKAIFSEGAAEREQMRGQMQAAREALRDAVKGNKTDAEIERIAAELGAMHARVTGQQAKQQRRFYQILNDEQKKKLETFLEQRGEGGPGGGRPR